MTNRRRNADCGHLNEEKGVERGRNVEKWGIKQAETLPNTKKYPVEYHQYKITLYKLKKYYEAVKYRLRTFCIFYNFYNVKHF